MNKKLDFSIANRISRWHFGEALSNFLTINIVLLIFFSIAVISAGETHIEKLMAEESYSELSLSEPSGVKIPFIKESSLTRTVIYERDLSNWWNSTLAYRVWAPLGDGYAAYEYDFTETARLSLKFLIALAAIELLMLLAGIRKSLSVTRSALHPLAELTETTQNISRQKAQSGVSRTQLRDLAGKLDQIDADGLETRISVESPQKELSGLAEAINGMLDRINESYNSQVRFVSDASHELRTPIAVIQGYANLLDRWGKNDEKVLQESIDTIKSEAQNMKDLVEQLLFLARGDNDSLRLDIETLNISAIARDVIRETEMIAPSHAIACEIEEGAFIHGDAQLMKQALRILMDNSVKYTSEKDEVKIALHTEGEKVKIAVSDNGIGIVPEDLPYIFDRFFRSDDSRTRKTGGSGLGLSIAKWIVERHGGSVEVVSRKDIGTRITLSFDAVKSPIGFTDRSPS
ncbi:MAG: HAMP domain-containing histidine kinase [Clostridiales bacterium]|nr:HAMP domain-containing histidine kinase [Clostridiales bacterium]